MLSSLFEIAARPGRRNLQQSLQRGRAVAFSGQRRHHLHNRQKPEPR